MTERLAVVARERVSWRALVLAALSQARSGRTSALRLRDAERGAAAPPAVAQLEGSSSGLATLSAASRAALSAAAGAKDPAYSIHGSGAGLSARQPLAAPRDRVRAQRRRDRREAAAAGTAPAGDRRGRRAEPGRRCDADGRGQSCRLRSCGHREWYRNGTLGLEQGFTVAHAPAAGTALTLRDRRHGEHTRDARAGRPQRHVHRSRRGVAPRTGG